MAAGRPRVYKTNKALRTAVDAYFASISRTETLKEAKATDKKDKKGHVIYQYVPVLSNAGEPISYIKYYLPPTVSDLCTYLKIHRSTWDNYCDDKLHPEFFDTTTHARGRLFAYLERESLTREGKDLRGVLFNLQANYGLSEKREVEFGPRASKTLAAQNMSTAEKMALLEEMQREVFAEPEEAEDETEGDQGAGA